jgi:group I intron endonuclease
MEIISGIYKISSKIKPERCYIGSAVDINKRWTVHLYKLKKGAHHSVKLQNHVNKYKIEDLIFETLLTCGKTELIEKEQFFLDTLHPYFNICYTAGNTLGRIPSETTRNKIREKKIGNKPSPETRKKMSESGLGRQFTEEHRAGISKGRLGMCFSEEHRNNISKAKTGTHRTPESRKKQSESMLGVPRSEESIRKMVETNTGKRRTPEQRKRMSEAQAGHIPWNKGKTGVYSPETLKRIGDASKGRYPNDETRKRQSDARIGKHPTEETRKNMSEAAKLRWEKKRALAAAENALKKND